MWECGELVVLFFYTHTIEDLKITNKQVLSETSLPSPALCLIYLFYHHRQEGEEVGADFYVPYVHRCQCVLGIAFLDQKCL